MTKSIFTIIALSFVMTISKAQTAMQFSGVDCNGNNVDLFADLDAGKAVILEFYMPNCGSCPPPAQKMQAMANAINAAHPGMVKGYAFPYQNTTNCTYSKNWVNNNGLSSIFTPMDSGAMQVAYYGGFGMPTVVLLGGSDHRVLFSTLSFSTSDTTIMRDSILALLATGINEQPNPVRAFTMSPNPSNDNVLISYEVNVPSTLLMDVTDITGRQVAIIADEKQSGLVTKQFNTATLANGNYFIRIQANGKTATQKLTVNH